MRKLLKHTYIPFGSQYYRAPSPLKKDWDSDLKNMADLGFNTVKFWVQWRWNNPAEGEFNFDDIDELMNLSQKYKLRVMLNTIFDVAPAWIYKKYSDASMITLNGRKIGPQTQPHRQIGGLGYCLNHDEVTKHQFEFLAETVKQYRNHPALEIWNVGSEPELTSSMAEMRAWADDAEKIGDMLCFCQNCQTKFRNWLKSKYNTVEQLNESWNRNYSSFEEVEIPVTRNTINDIIDWRMFFVYTLGQNVKRRFEVAKTEDKGTHPLMCHHVFIQGFPVTSTANDPWNVGQYGDLHGFTQMDDAMMIDVLRSCAKEKPVISAEMLMLPGYTLDVPQEIDANDVKRFIFSGVAGNQKGFIFWQYRPEILGRETPTWGLSHLDGTQTDRLKSFAEVGRVLQKNTDLILDGKPCKAEIAMIYNPENQIFAWMATKNEKTATDSLLGVHRALYEHNFVIDLIHPIEFEKEILKNYKCVYVPFPYVLNAKIAAALKTWVAAGGLLIGESYFAGWNTEHGHHQTTVPGYGLHEVFQARQFNAVPADEDNRVVITIKKDLKYINKGKKVYGSIICEQLTPEGAEVLATFEDGTAAITLSKYGKGKAILIGSYAGLHFHRSHQPENGELIASLAELAGIEKPQTMGNLKIRTDILTTDNAGHMLIFQNLSKEKIEAKIVLPGIKACILREQFDNQTLDVASDGVNGMVQIALKPSEVRVYVVE